MWTWTALDADTKLMICWQVGERDAPTAYDFAADLESRLANRVQLTTDGLKVYLTAVENAFGADIDFAQLVKLYGEGPESEKRYSPAVCIAAKKKLANHTAAIALHFMYYNFARPHQSLKEQPGVGRTPAVAAGIADRVWSVEEIVRLLDSD